MLLDDRRDDGMIASQSQLDETDLDVASPLFGTRGFLLRHFEAADSLVTRWLPPRRLQPSPPRPAPKRR